MRDAHDRPRAYWSGEDIDVTFVGRLEKSDYGVPGSPTFIELVDVEIEQIEILGVQVKPETLPNELLKKLHDLQGDLDW